MRTSALTAEELTWYAPSTIGSPVSRFLLRPVVFHRRHWGHGEQILAVLAGRLTTTPSPTLALRSIADTHPTLANFALELAAATDAGVPLAGAVIDRPEVFPPGTGEVLQAHSALGLAPACAAASRSVHRRVVERRQAQGRYTRRGVVISVVAALAAVVALTLSAGTPEPLVRPVVGLTLATIFASLGPSVAAACESIPGLAALQFLAPKLWRQHAVAAAFMTAREALHALTGAGQPLVLALRVCAGVVPGSTLAAELSSVAARLAAGDTLPEATGGHPAVVALLEPGGAGNLPTGTSRAARLSTAHVAGAALAVISWALTLWMAAHVHR